MSVDYFLDTNVIVYAAAGRGGEEAKRERALELIETREFGLSAQVLQEFYVTVVHKIAIPLASAEALEWIEQLQSFPCLAIDGGLAKIAAEISKRHRISYWTARSSLPRSLSAHSFSSPKISCTGSGTDPSRF